MEFVRDLVDLAEHLDHPAGDDLVEAVRHRIAGPISLHERARRRSRTRVLVAIAAALVVIVAAVVTISPARQAIADWLGIGAVELRRSDRPLPNGPPELTVPGAYGSTGRSPDATQLAAAQRQVQFAIRTARDVSAGALSGVEVDSRVRGGLVVLRYERFTLVEIATDPKQEPVIGKLLD